MTDDVYEWYGRRRQNKKTWFMDKLVFILENREYRL